MGYADADWGSSMPAFAGGSGATPGAAMAAGTKPDASVGAAWPPGQQGGAAGGLESTVHALGGFIEDDMPTFSEFKKVRASRKGLLPS